jgi:hypothetical protein
MTTYTLNTVVTEDIPTEDIVDFMLDNGSPAYLGEMYIAEWIEEVDPVGMTLGQLIAKWI